jgi:hypothetical protein
MAIAAPRGESIDDHAGHGGFVTIAAGSVKYPPHGICPALTLVYIGCKFFYMDQKIISTGGIITGIILIFTGVITAPLAIGVIASYPEKIWPLGIVLFICSGMILYGAIRSLRQSSKKLKQTESEIFAIRSSTANTGTNMASPNTNALVNWSYTPEEWKRFCRWEWRERKMNSIIVGLLIAIIGSLFLRGTRDASWPVAIAVSSGVGFLYGVVSYRIAVASMGRPLAAGSSVIITRHSVLINDKLNPFADDERWMGEVRILDDHEPRVLEIVYHWHTRKGNSRDEIRVPIPKGKLGEAVLLTEQLRNFLKKKTNG